MTLRPEAELLLACARVTPDPGARGRIAELAAQTDWDAFPALAARHGLQQLAYEHLAIAGDVVPKPVTVRLWSWRERLLRQNRLMAVMSLAGGVVDGALRAREVDAIPYKDRRLREELYGDVGCASSATSTSWWPPRTCCAPRRCWKPAVTPVISLTPATEQAFPHSSAQYHFAMVREDRSVVVELH